MSYRLEKPLSIEERTNFIVEYNHNRSLRIEETESAMYALEEWEELVGDEVIDNKEAWKEKQEQKEKERIANIALTRADVFEALILARGLTKQALRAYIELDETLNDIEKALYLNRFDDALEFYRKHPAIDFISAKLGISSDNMDKFFDTKDYTYLKPTDEPTQEEITDGK